MIKISDLLDHYEGALPELRAAFPLSVEGVAARTRQKISTGGGREPAPRAVRRLSRTALLAAALALLLVVSALAVSGLHLGEIPEGFRLWLGLADTPVPGALRYDRVEYAENAWFSDVHHVGRGELYLSEGQSVRSENLLTIMFDVWAVTPEQFESYVWRVQVEGQEDWLVAEPFDYEGGSAYYEGGRWLNLRLALVLDEDDTQPRRITLCGGYESEDGRSFKAERAGFLLIEPEAYSLTVSVYFNEDAVFTDGVMGGEKKPSTPGIPFANHKTGETGYITRVDISGSQCIWYFRVDGIYELYDKTYGRGGLSDEEWFAENSRLMRWLESMGQATYDNALTFSDGTELPCHPGEASKYLPDDTVMMHGSFRKPIDVEALESITFGGKLHGQTFAINVP